MMIVRCAIALMLVYVSSCGKPGEMNMTKADQGRPEPVLFLLEAADAMDAYHQKHHSYAREWNQLDIDFANGPFRLHDPGTHPTPQDKLTWQPKGSSYYYWIVTADRDHFKIEGRDNAGRPVYEITESMKAPKRLVDNDSGGTPRPAVK